MRRSSYFVIGALCGVVGILLFERVRHRDDPDDAELLSKRVSEYLGQLESRLEGAMHEKSKKA